METERLFLREFQVMDADQLFQLNADPDVIRYTGDLPFETEEHARQFLINYNDYAQNGYGRWAVILKSSNQFTGFCGLKLNELGLTDLGFRFFKNQWGKGFATESAKACLDYGFQQLQLKEIIGRAARKNTASIKVLEKLGMKYWKDAPCKNLADSVYYKITKADY